MINRIDWGSGRTLHGTGPGYLLLGLGQVLELRTGPAPELGKLLKGYKNVMAGGELDQLVYHLSRIYGGFNFGGIESSQDYVLCWIANLLEQPPEKRQEMAGILASKYKAAAELREWSRLEKAVLRWEPGTCKLWTETAAKPLSVTDSNYGFQGGPSSLISYRWQQYLVLCDRVGNREPTREELLKYIEPISFAVRTAADSVFAKVATDLGRLPTKKEIREELCVDTSAAARYCHEFGFSWLPEADRGTW